jgi:hypothetical protein
MNIAVSRVVNVRILTSPTFPQRKGFGLLNIIGTSARLPLGDRARFYSDMDSVAADFSASDPEYKAATVFFSQAPRPTQLMISRRFATAAPGELLGSVTPEKDIEVWSAIDDGAFTINIDGGAAENITAIDLTAVLNLNGVASAIQTKLAAASVGTTCIYDGTRFIIRSGTTGVTSSVSFTTAPGAGTDLGPLLGTRAEDLGITSPGVAAEAIEDSLDALQDFNNAWYGFNFTSEVTDQNIKDAAAWAEARVKIFGYTTNNSDVLDTAATTDIASYMKENLYNRTFGVWDDNDDYSSVSAIARAFTVNFNEQNSTLTLKFKQLPGTTPVSITESQRQAMVAKNMNYYTYFGDSAMLAEGVMAGGQFFDERHGLDWLQNAVETNVFGFLFTRPTKVPQTDKGVASLVQQVEKACAEGVNNGLLAPGVWNGMDLGEVKSGDFLPRGYYVYAQPVAQQNQSDREARKAPPIQALIKGAGAIHSVDVTMTFER